jgi:hypothetical protein
MESRSSGGREPHFHAFLDPGCALSWRLGALAATLPQGRTPASCAPESLDPMPPRVGGAPAPPVGASGPAPPGGASGPAPPGGVAGLAPPGDVSGPALAAGVAGPAPAGGVAGPVPPGGGVAGPPPPVGGVDRLASTTSDASPCGDALSSPESLPPAEQAAMKPSSSRTSPLRALLLRPTDHLLAFMRQCMSSAADRAPGLEACRVRSSVAGLSAVRALWRACARHAHHFIFERRFSMASSSLG